MNSMKLFCVFTILSIPAFGFLFGQTRMEKFLISTGANQIKFKGHRLEISVGQSIVGKIQVDSTLMQLGYWNIVRAKKEISLSELRSAKGVLSISQNFPNPFYNFTSFDISLPEKFDLKILVYNLNGVLVDQVNLGRNGPGTHRISWNASRQPGGIYFFEFNTGDQKIVKKVIKIH